MVMEAIWLSIQVIIICLFNYFYTSYEMKKNINSPWLFSLCFKQETEMERSSGNGEIAPCSQYVSEEEPAMPSSCAISALAERQQMVGESSNHNHNHNVNVSSYTMLPGNCDSYYDVEQEVDDIDHHHNHYHNNTEMGETGSSSYVSSYMNGEGFHNFPPPPPMVIVPESFEEQMMMAMAVSLAEVHATTTSAPTEVSWQ